MLLHRKMILLLLKNYLNLVKGLFGHFTFLIYNKIINLIIRFKKYTINIAVLVSFHIIFFVIVGSIKCDNIIYYLLLFFELKKLLHASILGKRCVF
jgi:hypothetical protein